MTTPTPDELREAAVVVDAIGEAWMATRLRALADEQEAEAEKTARRERLVEELAQTMHQTDVAAGHRLRTWAKTTEPIRDDFRRFARAVLDRFPSLLEAEERDDE